MVTGWAEIAAPAQAPTASAAARKASNHSSRLGKDTVGAAAEVREVAVRVLRRR
ncbi:hypothetical protein [Kutzneria buriramensis]|uniref:hypothetical protein n=1 Tax=Kutzneria buriramensis TaxID=1045776 RepID=UPI001476BF39|nr:hypothetical protein [Kutzneria buriramensis]